MQQPSQSRQPRLAVICDTSLHESASSAEHASVLVAVLHVAEQLRGISEAFIVKAFTRRVPHRAYHERPRQRDQSRGGG